MRFHLPLHLLPLCMLLLASGDAAADVTADAATASPPVVIAVDATLDADSRALVDSSIVSIAAALPHDTELGLIVFGDVVLQVVPLAPLRAAQLDEIDKALNAPNDSAGGNLAIGLERGIDELSEREAAHLLLFARARLGGADGEDSARFREWYRELLLPDAAERDIAITLVSPETDADADAAVSAALIAHPANVSYSLGGDAESGADADITRMLLRRILGGTGRTAETPGTETAAMDGDATGDIAAVTPSVTSAATSSTTSAATPSTTSAATASSATVSSANTSGATAVPDAASPDRRRLALYAVAALSLTLMVLLLALLARTRRAGSTARGAAAGSDSPTGGTSSTYLPLHATPTRSFTPAPRSVAASNTPTHGTSAHGTSAHGTSAHGTSAHGTSAHGVAEGDADERTRIRERDSTEATRLAPATRERSAAPTGTGVPNTPAPWDEHAASTSAAEKEAARSDHSDSPDELELLASLTAERNKIDPLD